MDNIQKIKTFVIFDIETTGLPQIERNQTKITEMTLIAVSRKDLKRTPQGNQPPVAKLTLMLNPLVNVTHVASKMTGLTNELLQNCPTFKEKGKTIKCFLQDLEKPVCLVAHNGNAFDFKILRTECLEARVDLPEDLLCVDSLRGFKEIEKFYLKHSESESDDSEVMTDDEDEGDNEDENIWPDNNAMQNLIIKSSSFKLNDVYERLFNRPCGVGHRSEADCLTLLNCIIAYQYNNANFIHWADDNCKKLTMIRPLVRY